VTVASHARDAAVVPADPHVALPILGERCRRPLRNSVARRHAHETPAGAIESRERDRTEVADPEIATTVFPDAKDVVAAETVRRRVAARNARGELGERARIAIAQ